MYFLSAKESSMPPNKLIYQFKITLKETDPPIWRRIQVPSTYSFWDLHVAIQDSMGWRGNHLHEFKINDFNGKIMHFGIPDEEFDEIRTLSGWEHKISKYFGGEITSCDYIYDFGDNWLHSIELEDVLPAEKGVKYPRCLAGERATPPEDCGGIPGYQELMEILFDPDHEDYADTIEWVESMKDGTFDPEYFDPKEIKFDDPRKRFQKAFQDG
jgi:hypothetical protein